MLTQFRITADALGVKDVPDWLEQAFRRYRQIRKSEGTFLIDILEAHGDVEMFRRVIRQGRWDEDAETEMVMMELGR